MVHAGAGGIDGVQAVLEDADAVAIQATDDRAAGDGAEVTAADSGLASQGLAEGGLQGELQLLAGEHGGGLGLLKQGALQRGCDDDFIQRGFLHGRGERAGGRLVLCEADGMAAKSEEQQEERARVWRCFHGEDEALVCEQRHVNCKRNQIATANYLHNYGSR